MSFYSLELIKAVYYYITYYFFMYFETFVIKSRLTHSAGLKIVNEHVIAVWLFEGKSKYVTKPLMYGPSGN